MRMAEIMRHPWVLVWLVVSVVALVSGVGLLAERAPGTPSSARIGLLQFNMCGHVCRYDSTLKADAVVNALADFHPAAVSLNEVCRDQLTGVTTGVAERDWPMNVRFLVTDRGGCAGDVDYGNAVLSRSAIVDTDVSLYANQEHGSTEIRGLLCARTNLGSRPTRVCSIHVLNTAADVGGEVQPGQVKDIVRHVASYRLPVVLMGDFNLRPTHQLLSALYTRAHRGGGSGRFDEVGQGPDRCRCGQRTHRSGAKYDYIFVTARDFAVVDGGTEVLPSRFSDHDVLHGVVTPRDT